MSGRDLRVVEKVVVVTDLEERSFRKFRTEAFHLFFSRPCPDCGYLNASGALTCVNDPCHAVLTERIRGIVFAKEVIDILMPGASPDGSSRSQTKYSQLLEAGCNALPRLISELRDEFAYDADGDRVEGEDGEYLHKQPMVVFPITVTGDLAWGREKSTEGFAIPEAMPEQYVAHFKLRQSLTTGMYQSLVRQAETLQLRGVEAPALLGLLDELSLQLTLPELELPREPEPVAVPNDEPEPKE